MQINCDMGESYGPSKVGQDELLMPYIDACNIACGFHGGDPLTIQKTITLAVGLGKKIGAHPSYPDLGGFGRNKIEMTPQALYANLLYQITALKGMVEQLGGKLSYVKPHGALYNQIAHDKVEAETVINCILDIDSELALMGLAGSALERLSAERGLDFIPEAFADRKYLEDGSLVQRKEVGAVLSDPEEASEQALCIAKDGLATTLKGEKINIKAKSICVHGDHKSSLEIAKSIDAKFKAHGFRE